MHRRLGQWRWLTWRKMKKMEAAHEKWQRKILRISWNQMITNIEVRARSGQMKLDITRRQRRLRWLGHVDRMDAERIPRQAMERRPNGKRGRGRPKMTWYSTVENDLGSIGLSWDIAAQYTKDRQVWRSWMPYVLRTGWTKILRPKLLMLLNFILPIELST